MSEQRTPQTWEEHYQTGNLPWDTGAADGMMLATLKQLALPPGPVLEIGCGTGTNAIALRRQGFTHVTATDLSPKAVEMARAKAVKEGVSGIDFRVHDVIASAPVAPASVDFVFDRGVFHSVEDKQRVTFAQRAAAALRPGGWWLSLSGNADDLTPLGPPRMTAARIAAVVEPSFEIHLLVRERFTQIKGTPSSEYLCWKMLGRKREAKSGG